MRRALPSFAVLAAVVPGCLALGCERERYSAPRADGSPGAPPAAQASSAPPSSSRVLEVSRSIRAQLALPIERNRDPRLAFGRGVLGHLTDQALVVYDSTSFEQLVTEPIDQPRALLSLADGALLAIGGRTLLHYEPGNRRVTPRVRPALLWGSVFPDAQRADRIWVLDADGSTSLGPPRLSSFALVAGSSGVALPEQTIALTSPRGGTFGVTREGVWLYVTPRRAERFSPGGLRLPGLVLPDDAVPARILPARRLDQCFFLDGAGQIHRAFLGPPFKPLSASVSFAGAPYSVALADEGRLLAATVVTGAGPRFELQLLDTELRTVARVELPSDPPTGGDDWVRAVTQNQAVVASARRPLVAVGGPSRMTVFGPQGIKIFSIPSG